MLLDFIDGNFVPLMSKWKYRTPLGIILVTCVTCKSSLYKNLNSSCLFNRIARQDHSTEFAKWLYQ